MDEKKLTDEELIKRSECLNNYWKSFMLDIIARKDAVITEQKAEIERLTKEKNDWEKSCKLWSGANKSNHLKFSRTLEKLCEERNKNAELQKQVDEYKAEIETLKNERVKTAQGLAVKTIFSMTAEHKKKLEEVEKNTAKEIYAEATDCVLIISTQEYGKIEVVPLERLREIIESKGVEVDQ